MQETSDSDRVGQQFRNLPQAPRIIDGPEVSGVQECIPIREIYQGLIHLSTRILELGEEPPRAQIMIVLIRFFQCIADEQMVLVVSGPVLFGAVRGDTTGIAGVFHMLGRIGLKVLWVRAIRGTFNGRGALTHGRRGGLFHDVEKIVGSEEDAGAGLVVFVGGVVTRGGYLRGERCGRDVLLFTPKHGEKRAF